MLSPTSSMFSLFFRNPACFLMHAKSHFSKASTDHCFFSSKRRIFAGPHQLITVHREKRKEKKPEYCGQSPAKFVRVTLIHLFLQNDPVFICRDVLKTFSVLYQPNYYSRSLSQEMDRVTAAHFLFVYMPC